MDPPIMKGLLLPHFDVDRSAIAPTIGWTIMPDSGPATQTADVLLFVRPRESRYGVPSAMVQSARRPISSDPVELVSGN